MSRERGIRMAVVAVVVLVVALLIGGLGGDDGGPTSPAPGDPAASTGPG